MGDVFISASASLGRTFATQTDAMLSKFVFAALVAVCLSQQETFPAVCYNQAGMKAAQQKCYSDQGLTLHLPDDPNNLKQVQNIMCQNLGSLQHLCTLNNTDNLAACGQTKYGQLTVADAMDPFKSTCAAYDHAEECLEEEIQECGQENLDLQKQFNQLQAPIACQSKQVGK